MVESMKKFDVAILGGGLAGNLLARQLRRARPDLSLALLERDTERSYKVGESTVEIATNYLVRRLGLSTYIYKEHLPKNGLRFFFDTEARDAELSTMSEIGTDALPPYPSFQLDRARLEGDLLEMNRADDVSVFVGARVSDLRLSPDGESHRFRVAGVGEGEYEARWVVDATGRGGLIARERQLRVPEKSHRVAAAWGRFHGVVDMDDYGPESWRRDVRYTSRVLSTNHFLYPGYWIWFIPLRDGLTSVGAVAETDQWDVGRHKPEGFLSFLRAHRAVRDLLDGSELVDLGAFAQLAFRTKQFFSAERWAVVGDAAAFVDPFYSPGSDFIAVENDMVADLIVRDFDGEAITERAETYDAFMHHRFDLTMVIYDGLYSTFGSYDLFRAKGFFDTACYYNLLFDSYARDEHLDLRWLRTSLRRQELTLSTMGNFASLFRGAAAELRERGRYFDRNQHHRDVDGRKAFGVMEDVGQARTRRAINARNAEIFGRATELVRDALGGDLGPLAPRVRGLTDAWSQLSGAAPSA
jgi:flavin-dependent dehydrogenase